MTLVALLCELRRRDARLVADGERLRVDAPQGALTTELRDALGEHKLALLEWVRTCRDDAVIVDFETRAAVDLEEVGARAYIAHPSFEVLCLVARQADRHVTVWTRGQPPPAALLGLASAGLPLVAHNASRFDRLVWDSLGWPFALWIDTVPIARLAGLPGQLDMLVWELLGRRKDAEGQRLTLALSRLGSDGRLPEVTPEALACVVGYCRTDVELLAEAWDTHLRPMRDVEAHVRALDEIINARGFLLDAELAAAVIECEAHVIGACRESAPVSAQTLASPVQLKAWLASMGLVVSDVRSDTLGKLLSGAALTDEVRRTIEARTKAAGITGHKLRAALRRISGDGRLRDTLNYYGAHTGRWSGAGFQPQNLPRGSDKVNVGDAVGAALARDVARLHELARQGGVAVEDVLASLVRPCVRAPPGRLLAAVDYSSIEARALLWLAGDEDGLEPFRAGQDVYKLMAATLLRVDTLSIEKAQRRLGKALVLGCGFGVGATTFRQRAAAEGVDWLTIGVTPDEAVEAWRDAHPLVAGLRVGIRPDGGAMRRGGMWRELEDAAVRACAGERVEVARTTWERAGEAVVCTLPSGRRMVYPAAGVELAPTPWGTLKPSFTFTHRGKRERSYGGKLAENVTQAVCRDLLAEALVRLDRAEFEIVLHVHDEVVAEVPATTAEAHLEKMKAIMREPPRWARGLPIAVEGYADERYG